MGNPQGYPWITHQRYFLGVTLIWVGFPRYYLGGVYRRAGNPISPTPRGLGLTNAPPCNRALRMKWFVTPGKGSGFGRGPTQHTPPSHTIHRPGNPISPTPRGLGLTNAPPCNRALRVRESICGQGQNRSQLSHTV